MRIFAILFILFVCTATHAWNARGHMIVAAIAYQELTKENQESITDILIHHPEYERKWKADYQVVKNEAELGLYLFMRASVWPDNIKSNNPDHSLNASKWHYMNYELRFPYDGGMKVSEQENVLDAIELNLKVFHDLDAPLDKRAFALCWLIHLVGDIHQPLHTVSLFSEQFPKGDRGGNSFWIKPKGAVKLHSFYTSDHPAFLIPYPDFGPLANEVFLPLTPKYAVSLLSKEEFPGFESWDHKVREIIDKKNITFYNSQIVNRCNRQVYSLDGNFKLAKKILNQNPGLTSLGKPRIEIL